MNAQRSRLALLASALITALLYAVPQGQYVIYPLLLLSTFVHEIGHGLTALLLGGEFRSLKVWADGSGVAMISALPGWRSAAVSAGGLVGPAMAGALCFFAARSTRLTRFAFWTIGLSSFFAMIWVVRNPIGWAVAGCLGLLCLSFARFTNDEIRRIALMFLGIQMSLSVFSRSDYLFKRVANTGGGTGVSDVGNIAQNLIGPHWFWGAVVGLLSVAIVFAGLYVNLRPGSKRT